MASADGNRSGIYYPRVTKNPAQAADRDNTDAPYKPAGADVTGFAGVSPEYRQYSDVRHQALPLNVSYAEGDNGVQQGDEVFTDSLGQTVYPAGFNDPTYPGGTEGDEDNSVEDSTDSSTVPPPPPAQND